MSVNDSAELAALAVEFVQSLDNVPHQVSHMLKEIEHKDVKCQELLPRIAERELQYRKLINSLPPGPWNINGSGGASTNSESQQTITDTLERADKVAEKISVDYSRLEEWSAQKASLSQKLWSVLHAHHTRLQSELARVDPKVIANVPVPQPIPGLLPPPSLAALSSSTATSTAAAAVAAATAASIPTARPSTNKGGSSGVRHSTPVTSALASLSNSALSSSAPMERGDGEEKDETLYCFCRQVSFGEMIGCDSETCKYEWFHIGCVGVSKPLPVTWYCEDCLKQMGNNSQNKKRKRQ